MQKREYRQCLFPLPGRQPNASMGIFITARACENQMYVCGINTTGTTPLKINTGNSMTADPYGSVISRANNAEQLLFSDLDASVLPGPGQTFRLQKTAAVISILPFPAERNEAYSQTGGHPSKTARLYIIKRQMYTHVSSRMRQLWSHLSR